MKLILNVLVVLAVISLIGGCAKTESQKSTSVSLTPTGQAYLADAEPENSMPVGEARVHSQDGDQVALVGLIGGSVEPFVEGMAAFTIVDPKVKYCPPEEGCPTPWDYCCTQHEVKENIATVKIVNGQGKTVREDARQLLGIKELARVVVQGKAVRDDQGNLSVMADKVYIKN